MLSQEQSKTIDVAKSVKSVYVYEAPIRIWHWLTVVCMVVLIATGIFIGDPFFSEPGNETGFLMGYVRFAHFAAGYLFAIGLLGRIYWSVVGNEHARQLLSFPVFRTQWWSEVMFELRWYFFLEDQPKKYVGHNPLALFMMINVFLLGSVFMVITGFALYSEGAGSGHWSSLVFGWVIPLVGDSLEVHNIHRLGMWYLICFIGVHVYAAVREDIMSRQSIISTMISGWRVFKD